ncbi:MAG: PH domain-containing protein [Planctomycetaceae bacterium]
MQVLTTTCPYCKQEVDSTVEHLDGPVECPHCNRPFDMEIPKAVVQSVRTVDETSVNQEKMAAQPAERVLAKVHPVAFRSRPVAALLLLTMGIAAIAALILSAAGRRVAGFAFQETAMLGPASLLTWSCAFVLLAVVLVAGYWVVMSRFETLTVTDDRTIHQQGWVSRDTSEVQHDDVRNIQLDQSLLQRLLDVGTVGISSSGQDDLEVVAKRLANPQRIIDLIRGNQT